VHGATPMRVCLQCCSHASTSWYTARYLRANELDPHRRAQSGRCAMRRNRRFGRRCRGAVMRTSCVALASQHELSRPRVAAEVLRAASVRNALEGARVSHRRLRQRGRAGGVDAAKLRINCATASKEAPGDRASCGSTRSRSFRRVMAGAAHRGSAEKLREDCESDAVRRAALYDAHSFALFRTSCTRSSLCKPGTTRSAGDSIRSTERMRTAHAHSHVCRGRGRFLAAL